MQPKLSIIIPCYNCILTLEESVQSIDTQHFDFPYEVIMVNDGSSDGTLDLIISLSKKYPNIKYISHENNRGGGATRNTGIKNSIGELIFCLDSDNILAPETLRIMCHFLEEKKADGVVIHERRFFASEKGISEYKSHWNTIVDRPITFDDIWNGNNILLDNFLYTRKSYEKAGKYQTEHGFDTQAFEISYLAHKNKVLTCPDSTFYHRQKMKQKSYFERVYENGELSINYYLSIEKILSRFSKNTVDFIINYDIFNKASVYGENLKISLEELYKKYPKNFLSGGNNDHLFIQAVNLYNKRKYRESINVFNKLSLNYPNSPIIKFNILRAEQGFLRKTHNSLTREAYKTEQGSKLLKKQNDLFKKKTIFNRVINKVKSIIKIIKK